MQGTATTKSRMRGEVKPRLVLTDMTIEVVKRPIIANNKLIILMVQGFQDAEIAEHDKGFISDSYHGNEAIHKADAL